MTLSTTPIQLFSLPEAIHQTYEKCILLIGEDHAIKQHKKVEALALEHLLALCAQDSVPLLALIEAQAEYHPGIISLLGQYSRASLLPLFPDGMTIYVNNGVLDNHESNIQAADAIAAAYRSLPGGQGVLFGVAGQMHLSVELSIQHYCHRSGLEPVVVLQGLSPKGKMGSHLYHW